MDFSKLMFTADGRIGRQPFWIGWLICVGANLVLGWIPLLGWLLSLVIVYCSVCITAKRLHDMGRSGWLQLIPIGIMLIGFVICMVLFGATLITAAMSRNNDAAGLAVLGTLGGFFGIMGLCVLVSFAFLIWVGVTPGQPGANRYGPGPDGAPAVDVF